MEMEIVAENPAQLCRICLNNGTYQLNAEIMLENERIVLGEMLKEFSSIDAIDLGGYPSKLCTSCLSQLSDSYVFLKKVQRSDESIQRLLDGVSSIDGDDDVEKYDRNRKPFANDCDYNNSNQSTVQDEVEESNLMFPVMELIEELPQDTCLQHELDREPNKTIKIRKRSAKSSKKPTIVLTETVSSILSRARKTSVDDIIEEVLEDFVCEDEPPNKKLKPSRNDSLIVTKFVLEPFHYSADSVNSSAEDINDYEKTADNSEQLDRTIASSQIQTIDMTAVEINANSKIRVEEIDDETNIEDPNRVYMCKYCPKAFSTSHHLLMHSRKSHICQFCTQSFTKVEDLHRHSKEVHTSFKCSLCDKDFSSNSNLRQHIKRVHNIELPAFVSLLSIKRKDNKL